MRTDWNFCRLLLFVAFALSALANHGVDAHDTNQSALALTPTIGTTHAPYQHCGGHRPCIAFQDDFCEADTSALWTQHDRSEQPRQFGTGAACAKNTSRYYLNEKFDFKGGLSPKMFITVRALQHDRAFMFALGAYQDRNGTAGRYMDVASGTLCLPGVPCRVACRSGVLRGSPDVVDRSMPMKLGLQVVGKKTLHWALYNNDTSFVFAKSDSRVDPSAPLSIRPGYILALGTESAESCAEDFVVAQPTCNMTCDDITDQSSCTARSECMWRNGTCFAYATCPFDLGLTAEPCFNPACDLTSSDRASEECCSAITNYCASNPEDIGCDCELLGFRCPKLACDSATFTLPTELCSATIHSVVQTSKRCEPGLNAVSLQVTATKPLHDVMCAVLVEEHTGLNCVSEPCLFLPAVVDGTTITCNLSRTVLQHPHTLRVHAITPNPDVNVTQQECNTNLLRLSFETHGSYAADCEPCEPARAPVLDVSPSCNLAPNQLITAHTDLHPLETASSCVFWKKVAGQNAFITRPDWVTPVIFSTPAVVTCHTPPTFSVSHPGRLTLNVEGFYPHCARPPQPSIASSLLEYNLLYDYGLSATCEACSFEDAADADSVPLVSPCDAPACSSLVETAEHSPACCDAIAAFCTKTTCSCSDVTTAGCSVAHPCASHSFSQIIGSCALTDVVVKVVAMATTIESLRSKLGDAGFLADIRERISLLHIPSTDVSCVFLDDTFEFDVQYVYVHFSNQHSASVFEDAIRSGSYHLFSGSGPRTTLEPPTSPPPSLATWTGVATGIALVLVVIVVVGAGHVRRAKRAPPKREAAVALSAVQGSGQVGTQAKVAKQISLPQGPMYEVYYPHHHLQNQHQQPTTQSPSLALPPAYSFPTATSIDTDVDPLSFYSQPRQVHLCASLGIAPLHLAAALNDTATVTCILDLLKPCSLINVTDNCGQTPLMWACQYGTEITVDQLLAKQCAVDVQDSMGMTALHHACRCGNTAVVALLAHAHADTSVLDNAGDLAVHHAARAVNAPELLGTLGTVVPILDVCSKQGRTLLIQSVIEGKPALQTFLLQQCEMYAHRTALNMVDAHARSALHWAALVDDVAAAESLLAAGADPSLRDQADCTALDLAVREGCDAVAAVLNQVTPTHSSESGRSGSSHSSLVGSRPSQASSQDLPPLPSEEEMGFAPAAASSGTALPHPFDASPPPAMNFSAAFELPAFLDDVMLLFESDAQDLMQHEEKQSTSHPTLVEPTVAAPKAQQTSLDAKKPKRRKRIRKSGWTGTAAQRERNKEACRIRRERIRREGEAHAVEVDKMAQHTQAMRDILAQLNHDRHQLRTFALSQATFV
eukprot:m.267380 g.267380  ORF g.267380 m.267380 type:complete len:1340 (-) comp15636_c0_seq1:151-4170(-)